MVTSLATFFWVWIKIHKSLPEFYNEVYIDDDDKTLKKIKLLIFLTHFQFSTRRFHLPSPRSRKSACAMVQAKYFERRRQSVQIGEDRARSKEHFRNRKLPDAGRWNWLSTSVVEVVNFNFFYRCLPCVNLICSEDRFFYYSSRDICLFETRHDQKLISLISF